MVAKRLDCPYVPGRRSQGWVKVKNVRRAEVVIGGWLPGEGGRAGRLGALVVGYPRGRRAALRRPRRHGLQRGASSTGSAGCSGARPARDSPFEGRQPPKLPRFVEPDLVAAVEFSRVDPAPARCASPSYKGLRDDVAPAEVRGPAEDS